METMIERITHMLLKKEDGILFRLGDNTKPITEEELRALLEFASDVNTHILLKKANKEELDTCFMIMYFFADFKDTYIYHTESGECRIFYNDFYSELISDGLIKLLDKKDNTNN